MGIGRIGRIFWRLMGVEVSQAAAVSFGEEGVGQGVGGYVFPGAGQGVVMAAGLPARRVTHLKPLTSQVLDGRSALAAFDGDVV